MWGDGFHLDLLKVSACNLETPSGYLETLTCSVEAVRRATDRGSQRKSPDKIVQIQRALKLFFLCFLFNRKKKKRDKDLFHKGERPWSSQLVYVIIFTWPENSSVCNRWKDKKKQTRSSSETWLWFSQEIKDSPMAAVVKISTSRRAGLLTYSQVLITHFRVNTSGRKRIRSIPLNSVLYTDHNLEVDIW